MDIEKIQAAITAMPSTKVQGGKTYSMVAQRVEAFRKNVGAESWVLIQSFWWTMGSVY